MPVSTADVPGSKRPAKAPEAPASPESVAPDPALRPGAASTDPAVHHLLAERDVAAQNGDDALARKATDALAALGYR